MAQKQTLAAALEKRKEKEQSLFNRALLFNIIILQLGVGLTTCFANFMGDEQDSMMLVNLILSLALIVICLAMRLLSVWYIKVLGYVDLVLMVCTFVVFVEVNYYLALPSCSQGSLR
jgi:Ca2+/Na+ antiporter